MARARISSPISASLTKNVIPSYFPMPSPSTPISVIFKENKSFFFILLTCEVGVKISFGSDFILRIFVSSRRLYPCHSRLLSGTFARISRIVSIFASTLSAKLKAIASTSAGFFGDPYSSSPWCARMQCFNSFSRTTGNPSMERIPSPTHSAPIIICPSSCPASV